MKLHKIKGPACELAVHEHGAESGAGADAGRSDARPVVVLNHSILSASMMWDEQAQLLASHGFRVLCVDTRGHGASSASAPPYSLDDLGADFVAVLDALRIERAHFVGLSLGGMTGFGLGINHAARWESLVLCDCRADAPAAFAAPWDERIAQARAAATDGAGAAGCAVLADSTTERWFGKAFLEAKPALAAKFKAQVGATHVDGFEGSARAIQKLNYLPHLNRIKAPTTLIVGANDGPLPQAMRDIAPLISGAQLEVIEGAGHLPNIDQPQAFNAALLRHFVVKF